MLLLLFVFVVVRCLLLVVSCVLLIGCSLFCLLFLLPFLFLGVGDGVVGASVYSVVGCWFSVVIVDGAFVFCCVWCCFVVVVGVVVCC